MPQNLSRELGLLRIIVSHLERRPFQFERMTQDILRREGIGQAREAKEGIYVIRIPGHLAFNELTSCILDRLPMIERGCFHVDIQDTLFTFLIRFIGHDPGTIRIEHCETLIGHFVGWFSIRATPRCFFVPCVISPTPATRFSIGPVTFEFIDALKGSDFGPSYTADRATERKDFDKFVHWMKEQESNWLARVTIENCDQERGREIAEITTDLAITALQIAAPKMTTRNMSRLNDRRGPEQQRNISEINGIYVVGMARKGAGIAIGKGTMSAILSASSQLMYSIGNVLNCFASGAFRLPILERAWCDATYWHHQALAEPIDSIAITKLETSLEVLLVSESSVGSERRLIDLMGAFFDLRPDDPIYAGSTVTVRESARKMVRDRSRILHGTSPTLSARGVDRVGLEGFVATVLRISVTELEAYAQSPNAQDSAVKFLTWIQNRKGLTKSPEV